MERRQLLRAGAALAGTAMAARVPAASARAAGGYPARPVQLVVPFPPGGPVDILARFLSRGMSEDLGQPLVIVNHPGAGGNIGSNTVAKASADGYTLLVTASSHVINAAVYTKMPYDALADFTPISLLAAGPFVLTVRNGLAVHSVEDLVNVAKAKPHQLNYASAGTGTANHLAGELFKQRTGVDIIHVPYNGAAPASQAILTGVVDILFNNMLSGMPMIRAKQVRALAVTGPKRSPALPELPTIAESGVPGYDVQTWYVILGPAGLSEGIQQSINASAAKVLATAEGRKLLSSQGLESTALAPSEVAAFMAREQKMWAEVAKASGAKVD